MSTAFKIADTIKTSPKQTFNADLANDDAKTDYFG